MPNIYYLFILVFTIYILYTVIYIAYIYIYIYIYIYRVAQLVKNLLPGRRPRFDPWVGKIHWKRKWQPTPVFLPGEFYGHRSWAGYSSWGCKELDTTEWLIFTIFIYKYGMHLDIYIKALLSHIWYLNFLLENKFWNDIIF